MKKFYSVNVEVHRTSCEYSKSEPSYYIEINYADKEWWFNSFWKGRKVLKTLKIDPEDREQPQLNTFFFDKADVAEQWVIKNIPDYNSYDEYVRALEIKYKVALKKYNYSKLVIIKMEQSCQ